MRAGFQQGGGFQNSLSVKSAWGGTSGICEPLEGAVLKGPYAGAGFAGTNPAAGTGICLATDSIITLDAEATAGLLYMIEEEKMARDLYDAFFEQTGNLVFDRISNSEQRHLDSLLSVAERAGVDTSALSTTAGLFTNTAVQSLYDSLLAAGDDSLEAALQAAITLEQSNIVDLASYGADPELGILGIVYAHLEQASERHLAAFALQDGII
jgi:hypothetical protein